MAVNRYTYSIGRSFPPARKRYNFLVDEGNYLKFRGKCKEFCERAIELDLTLKLVRGYYHDAFWGKQEHWWTVREDGSILDPTKLQFPDQGGEYEEFDGVFHCEQCGTAIADGDGVIYGAFIFCSGSCVMACVM
jgi:hypothetical protein